MSSPTSALGVMAPRCAPRAVGHSCTVVHCQCAKQSAWPACKEVAACHSQTDFWDCLIPRLSERGVGERADNTHGAGWPAAVTSQKRNAPHHQRRDGGLRGGPSTCPGYLHAHGAHLQGSDPLKRHPTQQPFGANPQRLNGRSKPRRHGIGRAARNHMLAAAGPIVKPSQRWNSSSSPEQPMPCHPPPPTSFARRRTHARPPSTLAAAVAAAASPEFPAPRKAKSGFNANRDTIAPSPRDQHPSRHRHPLLLLRGPSASASARPRTTATSYNHHHHHHHHTTTAPTPRLPRASLPSSSIARVPQPVPVRLPLQLRHPTRPTSPSQSPSSPPPLSTGAVSVQPVRRRLCTDSDFVSTTNPPQYKYNTPTPADRPPRPRCLDAVLASPRHRLPPYPPASPDEP